MYDPLYIEVGPRFLTEEGDSWVRLRPFPGHTSRFRFSLRNNTRIRNEIREIVLYALPPIKSNPLRKGRLYVGEDKLHEDVEKIERRIRQNSFTNLKPVAIGHIDPEKGFSIPGNSTVQCTFKNPDSEEGGIDPFNGMVMVVTDVDSQHYIRFFEIEPLHPSEYLDEHVTYDESQERIVARFRVKDRNSDGIPDFPTDDRPIRISWNTREGYPRAKIQKNTLGSETQEAGKSHYAEADSKTPEVELFWIFDLNRGNGKKSVHRFDVDGYPRAFSYLFDLNMEPKSERLDGDHDAALIRINWIHNATDSQPLKTRDDFNLLYHSWSEKPEFMNDEEILKIKEVRPFFRTERGKEAVFAKSDYMVAEVQVDASDQLFRRFQIRYGDEPPQQFRDLRAISGRAKVSDDLKNIVVTTMVHDHRISFPTKAQVGHFSIRAELLLIDGDLQMVRQDEVEIVYDDNSKSDSH